MTGSRDSLVITLVCGFFNLARQPTFTGPSIPRDRQADRQTRQTYRHCRRAPRRANLRRKGKKKKREQHHFAPLSASLSLPLCLGAFQFYYIVVVIKSSQARPTQVKSYPYRGHFATTLRPLCDHFATTLRPLCEHFATDHRVARLPFSSFLLWYPDPFPYLLLPSWSNRLFAQI